MGAAGTKTFLGSRYHRLARRHGKQRAWSRSATPSSPSPATCCPTPKPLHPPRPDWHDRLAPIWRKRQLIAELERLSGMKVLLQEAAA